MKFLEAFKRKPMPTAELSDAQIARIAANAARKMVAKQTDLLTPQTKARVLRDISEAEQADIAKTKPQGNF